MCRHYFKLIFEIIGWYTFFFRDSLNDDLFVNILISLNASSDLKWTLKPLNTEQYSLKHQDTHISNYLKQKILEHSIKVVIQKVCIQFSFCLIDFNIGYIITNFIYLF